MKLYLVEIRKASAEWSGCATPAEINELMEKVENAFYHLSYNLAVFDSLEKAQNYARSIVLAMTISAHTIYYEVISIEEVEKEEYDVDPVLCNRNMIDYFIPELKMED